MNTYTISWLNVLHFNCGKILSEEPMFRTSLKVSWLTTMRHCNYCAVVLPVGMSQPPKWIVRVLEVMLSSSFSMPVHRRLNIMRLIYQPNWISWIWLGRNGRRLHRLMGSDLRRPQQSTVVWVCWAVWFQHWWNHIRGRIYTSHTGTPSWPIYWRIVWEATQKHSWWLQLPWNMLQKHSPHSSLLIESNKSRLRHKLIRSTRGRN